MDQASLRVTVNTDVETSLTAGAAAYRRAVREAGIPALSTLSIAEARDRLRVRHGLVSIERRPVTSVSNRTVEVDHGVLGLRIYSHADVTDAPAVLFFHGGGWALGSLDTCDPQCRALVGLTDCTVVSVDYRLAPEHKYPAALDDAWAALNWLVANGREIGVDPDRIAVAGDSSGGNLAASLALMARDRSGPTLSAQVIVYGILDRYFDTVSYYEEGEQYILTRSDLMWFWDHYLPADHPLNDPYAAPLRARDLAGLPSTTIVVAEHDPLRDENLAYAHKLRAHGVDVAVAVYRGAIHGFFGLVGAGTESQAALEFVAQELRRALGHMSADETAASQA